MAAWLAYLKSRLLLPEPPKAEEPSAIELAGALAARLRRLEAMRRAADILGARPQLGVQVFGRGVAATAEMRGARRAVASLYDLLSAYGQQRQRNMRRIVTIARRPVWSLIDAREALERLVGRAGDWIALDAYLLQYVVEPGMRASVLASSLSAALEFVKEGRALLRQDVPFAPLMLRQRGEAAA